MVGIGRSIQALVLLSVLLGVVFLVQVYGVLPVVAFDVVFVGWLLFVLDGVLTFVRPSFSYYLASLLSIATLGLSLPESAHYAFIQMGELLPSATFILGSAAQVLIIVLVSLHVSRGRKKDEWAWPGAKSAP